MDALNTKIKSIKTEKTLKVRPENIKSGVSIFGINGTYTGLVPTGTLSITENGTVDVTNYASASVNVSGGKNYQSLIGMYGTSYTVYTASYMKLTVAKTGTYTIKRLAQRLNTSGTSGTAIYINGSIYGSANETWGLINYRNGTQYQTPANNWQYTELNNVSLTEGQVVEIYSRVNSNGNYVFSHVLIIEEE